MLIKIFYRHGLLKKEFYDIAKLSIVFVMPILSMRVEIILKMLRVQMFFQVSRHAVIRDIFYFFHAFPACTKLRVKRICI
jgi:hypothetical protein